VQLPESVEEALNQTPKGLQALAAKERKPRERPPGKKKKPISPLDPNASEFEFPGGAGGRNVSPVAQIGGEEGGSGLDAALETRVAMQISIMSETEKMGEL